mmetsp:Transcript_108240/g.305065  ORF Transcript_108240/g.305065 Transcript_108240/m.305065 type:complete len:224 (+) Transcript_108240:917-1588(+)
MPARSRSSRTCTEYRQGQPLAARRARRASTGTCPLCISRRTPAALRARPWTCCPRRSRNFRRPRVAPAAPRARKTTSFAPGSLYRWVWSWFATSATFCTEAGSRFVLASWTSTASRSAMSSFVRSRAFPNAASSCSFWTRRRWPLSTQKWCTAGLVASLKFDGRGTSFSAISSAPTRRAERANMCSGAVLEWIFLPSKVTLARRPSTQSILLGGSRAPRDAAM